MGKKAYLNMLNKILLEQDQEAFEKCGGETDEIS
jgi:hypothetical protein